MRVKNLMTKLNVNFVLILMMFSLALAEEDFKPVEPEKIPGILRTISEQSKQNFEKIHTWQGELEVLRHSIDKGENAKKTFETLTDAVSPRPDKIDELTSSRIIFKCDLEKGLSYSKVSREAPTLYFDPADGRDLGTKSVSRCESRIMTNGYRLSAEPIARKKGDVVERRATKEKIDDDYSSLRVQPVYLPTYIFDVRSQVWHIYPRIAEIIEKEGKYEVDGLAPKVEQKTVSGDLQYRVQIPFRLNSFGINNVWVTKIFSANAVYNMISSERITADGEKLIQQKSVEYQKIKSICVPIGHIEDTYDFQDFTLQSHEERIFNNVRINEPISAETFTYKNLGLEDGDTFVDKIKDKEYKYKEAKLVEIEKKSEADKKGKVGEDPNIPKEKPEK
ncbi:MAG: hypothetical protein WC476_12560 [Phycisphaerae bacterium]|jgi:hypothetical protein